MKYSKCLNLLFFLLFFACQEQKKQETVVKNVEDSLYTSFQDKLANLNIHYKHCNPTFLDPTDKDLSISCRCDKNLQISKEKMAEIGFDSTKTYFSSSNKGYSFHNLDNGLNLLGIGKRVEGGNYALDFHLFDESGKYITQLFGLSVFGDAGFMSGSFAFFKNDTLDIHRFAYCPAIGKSKQYFKSENYIIRFESNKIFTDTLKKEKLEGIGYEESNDKIIKFYEKHSLKNPFGLPQK